MNKKIIIFSIIGLVAIGLIGFKTLRPKTPAYELASVNRGTIVQKVSETGTIRMGEEIKLGFKTGGVIEEINVKVGDDVEPNQVLAGLKTNQLAIQLQEAEAVLKKAQISLEKLLAGASAEEIKIAQTKVENTQITLTMAEKNLNDAYQASLNTLDNSELQAVNTKNTVTTLYRSYFDLTSQIENDKQKIETAVLAIETTAGAARKTKETTAIETALAQTEISLSEIKQALTAIRGLLEKTPYIYTVSSTDKTLIDTQRTSINSAIASLVQARQNLSYLALTIVSTRGQLQLVRDNLSLVLTPPRQEDIDLYRASVEQAQASVALLQEQRQETTLKSPTRGEVVKVNKRPGEIALSGFQDPIIVLIPQEPFQVKANIYEEDIIKIAVGNPVMISLPVLPDEVFKGRLVSIEPAEKLIEGVVYYEVVIDFESAPEGIRVGMSADIEIETARKDNALLIPSGALQRENEHYFVEVPKEKEIEKRAIEIGLRGSDNQVEVVLGLSENEKIILR